MRHQMQGSVLLATPANERYTEEGGGGGGDLCCFPAGTSIALPGRATRPIEQIRVGDQVIGFDGHRNVVVTVEAIESPIRDHMHTLRFNDGSVLQMTREHPVYTRDGWRSLSPASTLNENPSLVVGQLAVGDRVLTLDGTDRIVVGIEQEYGAVQTYNLSRLSGCNCFYANGFRAHDKAA